MQVLAAVALALSGGMAMGLVENALSEDAVG